MNIQFDNSVRGPSFHPSYLPHPSAVFHPDIYKRMTRFEEELLHSSFVERKIMEEGNPMDKIFPRISPLKHPNPDIKPNEIDLTTTGHRGHISDCYSGLSPRFYGKKEVDDYSQRSPPLVIRDKIKSSYCPVLVQVRPDTCINEDENFNYYQNSMTCLGLLKKILKKICLVQ